MFTIIDIEDKLRELKPVLASRFYVEKIGIFGSYSYDGQRENSDLDILVEFSKPVGWEFFSLEKFLEDALGLKIDLVTKNGIKKQLRNKILNQVIYV